MKTCFKCNIPKLLDDFYPHKQMSDGRLNKCKQCAKEDVAARIEIKKRDPDWVELEVERCRNKSRDARASGSKIPQSQKAKAEWVERNPHKKAANTAVSNALRDGRLTRKPCEKCGDKIAEAHHDDYAHPLNVRWLCDKHHKEFHNEKRRLERVAKIISVPF